jgi:hypothetical protein
VLRQQTADKRNDARQAPFLSAGLTQPSPQKTKKGVQMTKAQEVKKALKGAFQNLRCIGGKDTAYGWVHLGFDLPKTQECNCDGFRYCTACSNAKQSATQKVYDLIKKARVELYSYTSDDGYNSENDCMLIDINMI